MKKIGYVLAAIAAMCIACTPKDEVRTYANTAAQDAAGVYEGTWTSVSSLSGKETTYNGTIEFQVFKDTLSTAFCRVSYLELLSSLFKTSSNATSCLL